IHHLWTETICNFNGQYYQLKNAYSEPKPIQKPYPPFVIGGGGEKLTLRVAAQYANVWNFGGPIEDFLHKSAVLVEHCAAIGRDSNSIERSIQVFVHPTDLSITRNKLQNFIDAGATHLILHLRPPYTNGI